MKLLSSVFMVLSISLSAHAKIGDILATIPVQDGGRIKPLDSFARESLQLIYGKREFKDRAATEIVMTWLLLPEHWDAIDFIKVDRKDLKDALKLAAERTHFSPQEVLSSERLTLLFQDLQGKRQAQEKLDPYWQAVQTLENQISLYKGIVAGASIKLVPKKDEDGWLELRELGPELRAKFDDITKAFVLAIDKKDEVPLKQAVESFVLAAKAENPSHYATDSDIRNELLYNRMHPFQWSWIFYLLAAVATVASLISSKTWIWRIAGLATVVGFLIHTFGFYLRISLTGRPPVSNMYESVIWVSWGAILFAFIFESIWKKKFFLLAATILSVVCLILADLAPTVLDPTLQPLQPVLRSNLWLTVHVLTITLSYSAFFIAFILGDIGLGYYLRDEKRFQNAIQTLNMAIYRTMQVGVVLLFSGTVLGGVWADYSWGRFWGWDPKETWAFIALMGYIAILHGRLSGWIKPIGFMASSVIGFSLVIMAWYGVNFVLGAGLHSYGFGAGGVGYVSAFVAAHIIYVIFVLTVRQARVRA